jgi:hypothetical protein
MRTRVGGVLLLVGAGCGAAVSNTEEFRMSGSSAAYSQHRIFAESYILREIGEFDAASQARLMAACEGAPYQSADEALNDFGSAESVTQAQVEWMQTTWRDRTLKNPGTDPKAFAAEIANEVFIDVEF